MGSKAIPSGFLDLPPHRQIKVDLGNGLAQVSIHFAGAQERALSQWMKEQPSTSLMLDYEPVSTFLAAHAVAWVVVDVCAFGAPWRKPTAIIAKFGVVNQEWSK